LALANAEDLFREGTALLACRAFSRALFLHQISLEECGKAEMLGWWATGHLMGTSVDLSNMRSRLARHKDKNFANAYMLPVSEAEQKAHDEYDWQAAHVAFKEEQAAFHQHSNDRKNASLYVDVVDDLFVAPRDRITEQMVHEIAATNDKFIELMRPKVEMLTLWAQEPDGVRECLKSFRDRMVELLEEYSDEPQKAFDVLLDEMLTQATKAQQHLGSFGASPNAAPDEPSR
jgi:AbiV family abortive infection protein